MHDRFEKLSVAATNWIGTPASLVAHTILFAAAFTMPYFGAAFDDVLLVLTTIVSLEAIYLSIFIQMTVNRHAEQIEAVGEDIEDIQEEVEDLGADVEEISEDIEKIQGEDDTEEVERQAMLQNIQTALHRLLDDVATLKKHHPAPNHTTASTPEERPEPITMPAGNSGNGTPNYLRKLIDFIPFVGKPASEDHSETAAGHETVS